MEPLEAIGTVTLEGESQELPAWNTAGDLEILVLAEPEVDAVVLQFLTPDDYLCVTPETALFLARDILGRALEVLAARAVAVAPEKKDAGSD